jgi:hypothetical protein
VNGDGSCGVHAAANGGQRPALSPQEFLS